jgi:uncharacterized protein YndB with AHSA1/START domain
MASSVRGSVLLAVPIDRAWDLWVDAARYTQWQSMLLAVRDLTGPVSVAGTTYVLDHGPKLKRQARVIVAERPTRHVIEQTGMGIHDDTTATFEPEAGGTRLTVVVHYRMGRVLGLLSRLDRNNARSERELQHELGRLAAVALRTPPAARVGGLYVADAGTVRRRLTVIAVDPERLHIRLHPGHLRDNEPDDAVPRVPKPLSKQLDFQPLSPPLRASLDAMLSGLPFLRRDGGHGVSHLALSLDAWADASAREIGDDGVTPADIDAVEAWRMRGAPTVGIDADLDLTSLCTFRLDASDTGETWAAAKVLRSEMLKIHLRIPADRWSERPVTIPPATWSAAPLSFEAAAGDLRDIWPVMIGHYPLARATFDAAQPRFAGVATLEGDELDGYRVWRDARAGTFDSLEPVLSPGDPMPVADLLTPSSGVSFGDRARVVDTPLTVDRGLAGRVGTVVGHTTPSLAYVTDVIGESTMDVAVGLALEDTDGEPTVWLAAELIEFVDHGAES